MTCLDRYRVTRATPLQQTMDNTLVQLFHYIQMVIMTDEKTHLVLQ